MMKPSSPSPSITLADRAPDGARRRVGVWSLIYLPIDAVPDITNNQVQINAFAPALSAFEMEKQVTYPIENALAGIPGLEYTRSLVAQRLRAGDGRLRR